MIINLKNYEEHLVRYMDGECSSAEVAAIELFLKQHPEINAELNAFRSTVLFPDEKILFPGKELLKKGISKTNYEGYFVRKIEGDLSSKEAAELEFFISQHPELQREIRAFESTRLVQDLSVVFPDKRSLKRRDGKVVAMYLRYTVITALAACLMLIVMMKGINRNPAPSALTVATNHIR